MAEVQAAPASAPNAEAVQQQGSPSAPVQQAPEAVTKQIEALSNQVGALTRIVQKLQTPSAPTTPTTPPPDTEPRLSLAKVDERQQQFANGLKANAKRTEIKAAVAEKLGKKTDSFAKYVLNVYGEQFEVTDDMQVYVKDNGERTPVGQWADAFLKTDEGLMFMPPPAQPPSGEGLESSNGNGKKAHHPYSSLSYEQLMEKQRTDFAGVQKFAREHPDDYARIKNRR